MKIAAATLGAALLWAASGAAKVPSVNLLGSFRPLLAKIERTSAVPVLLPPSLPVIDRLRVYASGAGTGTGWELELAFAPGCGGATACFLASIAGAKTGLLPGKANARLGSGDPALFHRSTCGASCAPASLWFVHKGILYSWQDSNLPAKTAEAFLIRLADEAIAAGPR